MSTKPEALKHAAYLEGFFVSEEVPASKAREIAAALRLLADVEAERDDLKRIRVRAIRRADEAEAERDQLRAEAERAARNRDMWKTQCERQAAELAALRGPTRTGEAIDWGLTAQEIGAQYRAMAIEIEKLRADLANTNARDIHSCGPNCARAGCVNARLRLDLAQALKDRDEARAECQEQARIVGMGAERELALMAELKEARRGASKEREWLLRVLDDAKFTAELSKAAVNPDTGENFYSHAQLDVAIQCFSWLSDEIHGAAIQAQEVNQ